LSVNADDDDDNQHVPMRVFADNDDDGGGDTPSVLLSSHSNVVLAPIVSLCCAHDGFWARALLKTLLTSVPLLSCPNDTKRARLLKLVSLWEIGSGILAELPSIASTEPTLVAEVAPSVEFVPTKSAVDTNNVGNNLRRLLSKKREQSGSNAPPRHELTVEEISAAIVQRRNERVEDGGSVWQLCEPTTVPLGLLPNGLPSNLDLPPILNSASVMLRPVVTVPAMTFVPNDTAEIATFDDDDEDDDGDQ
jgi:hypothetical protein